MGEPGYARDAAETWWQANRAQRRAPHARVRTEGKKELKQFGSPDGLLQLRAAEWEGFAGLIHVFFGRHGGVSAGAWRSLNLGERVGDDPAAVEANWARVKSVLSDLRIKTMRQVHGTRVELVRNDIQSTPVADGMVTDRPGVGLAILTADCVPIFIVAPASRVAAAVHAGWRGTVGGIAREAVAVIERDLEVPAHELHVAMGPAIGGCCYEVKAEIGAELEKRWGAMPDAWRPAEERGMLDLRGANRRILTAAGVPEDHIIEVGPCTSCARSDFFSHRRWEGRTGRQLSVVGFV